PASALELLKQAVVIQPVTPPGSLPPPERVIAFTPVEELHRVIAQRIEAHDFNAIAQRVVQERIDLTARDRAGERICGESNGDLACTLQYHLPSFAANSACTRFHESSSAARSYFMPGLPCLSASATVKLCRAP